MIFFKVSMTLGFFMTFILSNTIKKYQLIFKHKKLKHQTSENRILSVCLLV